MVSMLDASLVPLPLPGSTDILVLLLAARHTAPWLLVVASVGGSVLGGSLTWSAGKKGGEAMLEKHVPKRFLARLERWVKHHGPASVATAAILPPPIPLMPFLLAAGALGVARKQFLWAPYRSADAAVRGHRLAGSNLRPPRREAVVELCRRMVPCHPVELSRASGRGSSARSVEIPSGPAQTKACICCDQLFVPGPGCGSLKAEDKDRKLVAKFPSGAARPRP